MKKIYLERKTLVKYDDNRVMAYLNEEVIDNYTPDETTSLDSSDSLDSTTEPVTAYQYEGDQPDGGTLIDCQDPTSRDQLINGIIRSRYSQTEEDAIKTHQIEVIKDPETTKATEYNEEWADFNAFRKTAISTVDGWLG